MKLFVLVLCGSKGAGKTTLSNALATKLPGVAFFGLVDIRRMMSHVEAGNEANAIAWEVIPGMVEGFLSGGVSVVINDGMNPVRFKVIQEIAQKYGADIFVYTLQAPRDILWNRVRERDVKWDKVASKERFDYVYDLVEQNFIEGSQILDSESESAEELARVVLRDMK